MGSDVFLDQMTQPPVHPGEVVKSIVLPELQLSPEEAAERVKLKKEEFAAFLEGQSPVGLDLATQLGVLCGNGPQLWLSMQALCDAWAEQHNSDRSFSAL